MPAWLKLCAQAVRALFAGAGSFVLWSFWLALALLLAAQAWIVTSQQLAVPGFILRRLEEQLAASGLRLTVGATLFDPTGRILVEDARLHLPAFSEPVVRIGALYLRLDRSSLLAGEVVPVEIRVTGASLEAPGQLTTSGRGEELLSSLDAVLVPGRHELRIERLTGRSANLVLTAHGAIPLPAAGKAPRLPWSELVVDRFPEICRRGLAWQAQLRSVREPGIDLTLSPAGNGGLALGVHALAREITITDPVAMTVRDAALNTTLTFPGERPVAGLRLSAREFLLPRGARADHVVIDLPGDLAFDRIPEKATLSLARLEAEGIDASTISARVTPGPWPILDVNTTLRLLDEPISAQGRTDLRAGSAGVTLAGSVSPRVLDVISRRVGVDVRRFYSFEALTVESAEARFGPGWAFERLKARVEVPRMDSYGVIMEDGRAVVELEPGRFRAPEAYARVGENFARGSYEQDFRTRDFRFLLEGQLRPLDIGRWFGPWWPAFFRQLDFTTAPPEASVDVSGRWREGRLTRVFVAAESDRPVVRGVALDRVRTRLLIRPGFVDGLEVFGALGDGDVGGTFTFRSVPGVDWTSLDFNATTSLGVPTLAGLLGEVGRAPLAPFRVDGASHIRARGRFNGPAATTPSVNELDLQVESSGAFSFYDFPLEDATFTAQVRGEEVSVEKFGAAFAGGTVTGNARLWGRGDGRRLGFNVAIEEAALGRAAGTLQAFLARRRGAPPPPPDRFVQERASIRLDVAASGEGRPDDPFSYKGDGNASLRGAGLGEVPLLGLLSELFTFTSLRFTEARGNFRIDGQKLLFPKVELRGANSAIDAHGDFTLGRNELNFNAKVFPFQESGNVLKSVVGAVLTPLSSVLEVKLAGTLEKPSWSLVMGPTNLLRSLTESPADRKAPAPETAPSAPPPPKP
ncbi:MAG: hypothetical protein RJB55_2310 [Verrucomicrobiota bacterium]